MKKGFTMIELLAVIVILGILALITVPVLLKTINEARRDSAIESANSYVSQVKKTLLTNSKKLSLKDITCLVDENGDGKTIICNGQALSVKAEGKPPICGKITFENYKLKSYIMNISGYRIIRTGPNDKEQVEKIEGCDLEEIEWNGFKDQNDDVSVKKNQI